MTDDVLEAAKARHVPTPLRIGRNMHSEFCLEDEERWPCDAAALIQMVEDQAARIDELERQVAAVRDESAIAAAGIRVADYLYALPYDTTTTALALAMSHGEDIARAALNLSHGAAAGEESTR